MEEQSAPEFGQSSGGTTPPVTPKKNSRVVVFVVGAVVLLAIAAVFVVVMLSKKPAAPEVITGETPSAKTDRLALMNLLNQFNQEENQIPATASAEERTRLNLEQVERVV